MTYLNSVSFKPSCLQKPSDSKIFKTFNVLPLEKNSGNPGGMGIMKLICYQQYSYFVLFVVPTTLHLG